MDILSNIFDNSTLKFPEIEQFFSFLIFETTEFCTFDAGIFDIGGKSISLPLRVIHCTAGLESEIEFVSPDTFYDVNNLQ